MRREPMSSKESATRHGSEGSSRALARVAPLDEKPGGGMDGSFVRRVRLGAEPPEIGVDEAGVEGAGRELRARAAEPRRKARLVFGPMTTAPRAPAQRGQRLGAGRAMGDQLGDHRIVERRDAVAGLDAGVDADALAPPLKAWRKDQPGEGRKPCSGSSA